MQLARPSLRCSSTRCEIRVVQFMATTSTTTSAECRHPSTSFVKAIDSDSGSIARRNGEAQLLLSQDRADLGKSAKSHVETIDEFDEGAQEIGMSLAWQTIFGSAMRTAANASKHPCHSRRDSLEFTDALSHLRERKRSCGHHIDLGRGEG